MSTPRRKPPPPRRTRPPDVVLRRLWSELLHAYSNGYDGIRVQFETMRLTAYRETESRPLTEQD